MKPKPTTPIKKLARELITTTCLTAAAAGAVQAATFNETSLTDFSNTFGAANVLPAGTNRVLGAITAPGDPGDYFKFTGLAGGSAFSIAGAYTGSAIYDVLDSSGAAIVASSINPATITGDIPTDGILIVHVNQTEVAATYDLTFNANTSVPEPSTAAIAGLGVAGAWLLRKRSKE